MNPVTTVDTKDQQARIAELKTFISPERDGRQMKKTLAVKLLYQGRTCESQFGY